MRPWPLVSAFVPTYNHVEFIDATLESVVNQDYRPLQIVLADDASTDGTTAKVREWADRYPELIVPMFAERNLGIVANCNRALALCTGEFVAFGAGDDIWLPTKLSRQVDWFASREERVMCGHDVEIFLSATTTRAEQSVGLYSGRLPLRSGRGAARLIRQGMLYPGLSLMIRRSALPASGYDPSLTFLSELKLWTQVLGTAGEYGYVSGVLGRYRRHIGSVTNDMSSNPDKAREFLRDRMAVLAWIREAYPDYLKDADHLEAESLLEAGRLLLWIGCKREARALFLAAARRFPTRAPTAGVLALTASAPDVVLNCGRAMVQQVRTSTRAQAER